MPHRLETLILGAMCGNDAVGWYDENAREAAERYERLDAAEVHNWLIYLLPEAGKSVVLDVGAGSGRDAAWFANRGDEVVAVEPSAAMRREGHSRHPHSGIRWVDDRLPGLDQVTALGMGFEIILLSAVWMHVRPADRPRAFRKLVNLLKPGGLLAITLRHGPDPEGRQIHPVTGEEIEALARAHGAFVEKHEHQADRHGRKGVSWSHIAVRLPDDGTGALPLLRHVILNDRKSSTYKLALLRTLCRIAQAADGMARDAGDDDIALPLGLVALHWVRLFHPLIAKRLPQAPAYRDGRGLGFVGDAFSHLLKTVAAHELRMGMRFAGDRGRALHQALNDTRKTIVHQPVCYTTYPNGKQILVPESRRIRHRPDPLILDEPYLLQFGELFVPRRIWHALQRFSVWIEPAICAEWRQLMHFYAEQQGRRLDEASVLDALSWPDPDREVLVARQRFNQLLESGQRIQCVWSGRRLTSRNVEIDHCFPWAAWPCGDLWNLVPAHQEVNASKGARLPRAAHLVEARERMLDWWNQAYVAADNELVPKRFFNEARASLPTLRIQEKIETVDVFQAAELKRVRLKQDQQIPEW